MQSETTAIEIEFIVWRVVTNIEVYHKLSAVNNDDSVDTENECDYDMCLFDYLDSVSCDSKWRTVNFVIDLVGRVDNFIEDDEFTEAGLRRMK